MRKLALFVLLAAVLLLNACSDGNSDSPSDTSAHPVAWFSTHPGPALATPDFTDCTGCHGVDLSGSGDAVSCFSCHSYSTEPPFSVHPPSWTDPFLDHRGFAATNGTASCTACHGQDLQGRQSAPSCFTASFDGQGCHADGPGQAPHPLDGSYLSGANHGPDAKTDLTFCQPCHGQPGVPGSNPRFNVGIFAVGGNGCESCHGVDYAHPQAWAGPNATFHYSAGNIQNACTLCHGVSLDSVGGVGVSCLGCHDSVSTFTLDCTFCHGSPPNGQPDVATNTGVDHSGVPLGIHLVCSICHGASETLNGGSFQASAEYTLFNPVTDTLGDHWNGNINMNSGTGYNPTNFGCDTAGCHANAGHQLSDSGLPVELKDYFAAGDSGSGGAPHDLGGSFLLPANHGPAAKGLTAAFPNGMLDCQPCHAQAGGPGSNPRFNVGINSVGGNGCETCHGLNLAHPRNWAGPNPTFHYTARNIENACTLCHGVNLDGVGGVGISCLSCHAEVATFALDCTSCHGYPPDGTTPEPEVAALNGQLVAHNGVTAVTLHDQCAICHGVKSNNTAISGALTPNANYRVFDPLTETNGDHWNSQINMNGPTPTTGAGYNQANFGCDNAGCHFNDTDHQLSDSALQVQFGDYGSASATHPLDGTFISASAHGVTAKADLASCKTCHGQATTTNPRYNIGITGNGCEGCHNDQTAHPSQGTLMASPRENVNWYDVDFRHSTGAKATFATACGVCHPGIGGTGTVGPACTFCHVGNPVTNNSGCISCHANPPNGSAAPDRRGAHRNGEHGFACDACHTNAGPGSALHFSRPASAGAFLSADLRSTITVDNDSMNVTIGANVSCAGTCHGSENWY